MNPANNHLQLLLAEGEGYKVEFKEKIAHLDREIVAFANANGGSIFLGITDHADIIGIDITNQLKSQITDIARNCDPSIKITLIAHAKNKVLEIKVTEGTDKPYRCKDGFFLRIGPSSQKLKRDEIINFINHTGKIHFDEAINDTFCYPQDFSKESLTAYLKLCGINTKLPAKDILLSLNIAKENQQKLLLTNTAILFFAKNPQKHLPESYITAVRYQTNDRFSIIDKKDFYGSPISQIEATMEFLIRHMAVATDISPDLQTTLAARRDLYDYPPIALREAIVNAVVHRDYFYDGAHIYVHMFPGHIDIENPGGLYHGMTLENLEHRSIRRNRLLADLLHRAGYIERVGSGFARMKHALVENNNPELAVSITNFFNIRFYPRLKEIPGIALSQRQLKLYQLIQEQQIITNKKAAMILGVSNDTARRELNILLALGMIEKSGEGKATNYKIVTKT